MKASPSQAARKIAATIRVAAMELRPNLMALKTMIWRRNLLNLRKWNTLDRRAEATIGEDQVVSSSMQT